ncbi:hypothetical protein SEUCBS140593_008173 [Sporothrix eucalyptigena]|uniref:Heterokaryon incompatibility domain-containing protein n=1 Tax=Sporothrix eucalyptigena TaxID=1812306 RepID=A0ABP0CJC8_9PEZI
MDKKVVHGLARGLGSHHFERILCVDTVCIDQSNGDEKAQQVQMMTREYNTAYRAIVWLGDSSEQGDEAFRALRDAASQQQRSGAANDVTDDSDNEPNQEAVIRLLQRPWFQRVWVRQEVATARSIIVKCSSVEIDVYAFSLGLERLNPCVR